MIQVENAVLSLVFLLPNMAKYKFKVLMTGITGGRRINNPGVHTKVSFIPLLFEVSMAFNMVTTSSISGLLLGFSSKHCVIIFARELGQQLGISGIRFCILSIEFVKLYLMCNNVSQIENIYIPDKQQMKSDPRF